MICHYGCIKVKMKDITKCMHLEDDRCKLYSVNGNHTKCNPGKDCPRIKCDETIQFGDDFGDNETTFHCQLEKGHKGLHKEDGIQYHRVYRLEWSNETK